MSENTLTMKRNIESRDKVLHGNDFALGVNILSHTQYISPPRGIMTYGNYRKHRVVPNRPDFPLLFTNYENEVGDRSSAKVKADADLKVEYIVPRFNTPELRKHLYVMFLYDEEKDKYTVFEKRNVEDLTEKFGFRYNTSFMDNKVVGDVFRKDDIIRQTVTFDDEGNCRMGLNLRFMYLTSNETVEDAMTISRSTHERAESTEVETIEFSLSEDNFLKNIYGNSEIHKGFPDIGEETKNVLCARGRFENRRLLYDAKNENVNRIDANSDHIFYCKGKIEDIHIYANKTLEEIPDNKLNAQIRKYLALQNEYYEEILRVTNEIIESGSKYSSDITHMNKRAQDILDPEVKWKEEQAKAFSNIVVEIQVSRNVNLEVGGKGTGRGGNKGVVSVIREDEDMPILENGKRVDIILNTLGVVNRLSTMQLFEQTITFMMARTTERMVKFHEEGNTDEAIELLVRMVNYFNERQAKELKQFIDTLSPEEVVQMIYECEERNVPINIPPIEWDRILFDVIWNIYDEEPWLKPYDVYIRKFGRYIKMQGKYFVGQMYFLKLKQTSTKGLTARSTGKVSSRGLPAKTKRDHTELYSKTPIRIGGDENGNMNIGEDSNMINMLHMYYRASVHGRKLLATLLATKMKDIEAADLDDEMISNRNVEILNAWNKILGLRMQFYYPDKTMYFIGNKNNTLHTLKDGTMIMGSDSDAIRGNIRIDVMEEIRDGKLLGFMTSSDFDEYVMDIVDKRYMEFLTRMKTQS